METTGFSPYRHDRIIEIAIVVIRPDGTVVRELTTFVNPERDIGPSSIHGLTARDILGAPRFGEMAWALLEVLDGCVAVAGHNVRFDHSFLVGEFDRIGHRLPDCATLCTMRLAGGGNLLRACSDYGVAFADTGRRAQTAGGAAYISPNTAHTTAARSATGGFGHTGLHSLARSRA